MEADGTFEVIAHTEKAMREHFLEPHIKLASIRGLGSILVVVNWFSKYATFITTPLHYSAEEVTKLMMKNVVKYLRVLHNIISD